MGVLLGKIVYASVYFLSVMFFSHVRCTSREGVYATRVFGSVRQPSIKLYNDFARIRQPALYCTRPTCPFSVTTKNMWFCANTKGLRKRQM